MNIQMTGHGLSISDALRDLTEKKLSRIQSHHEGIEYIHVTFSVEKIRQLAHAQLSLPGHVINASAESDDMYQTVDLLLKKLVSQLSKAKEKNKNG